MAANGTFRKLAECTSASPIEDSLGNIDFIASVTVNVVINILSAAGSRIVPRTELIWYLLAR